MITDLTIVKTYMLTDPDSLGLAPLIAVNNWGGLASALSTVRTGTAFVVQAKWVPVLAILGVINRTEFANTTQANAVRLAILLKLDPFPIGTLAIRNLLKDCTGPLSDTAIETLTVRQGSAIEKLYGADEKISWQMVKKAIEM